MSLLCQTKDPGLAFLNYIYYLVSYIFSIHFMLVNQFKKNQTIAIFDLYLDQNFNEWKTKQLLVYIHFVKTVRLQKYYFLKPPLFDLQNFYRPTSNLGKCSWWPKLPTFIWQFLIWLPKRFHRQRWTLYTSVYKTTSLCTHAHVQLTPASRAAYDEWMPAVGASANSGRGQRT